MKINENKLETVSIERNILYKNDSIAESNRIVFRKKNVCVLNILSSPGAGTTTLVEETLRKMKEYTDVYLIEGDHQSENDERRMMQAGFECVNVNSGEGCHLDASMIFEAAARMDIKDHSLVIIENVGNLVCPAMFDLGETKRVVMVSVTEGEEKPLKHQKIFSSADVCVLSKIDLAPLIGFDVDRFRANLLRVNQQAELVTYGRNMENTAWYEWIRNNMV